MSVPNMNPAGATEPAGVRRHPLDRMGIPKTLIWGYVGLLFFMIGDGIECRR